MTAKQHDLLHSQSKLVAFQMLPFPVYVISCGYIHIGLVKLTPFEESSSTYLVAIIFDGAIPSSTHCTMASKALWSASKARGGGGGRASVCSPECIGTDTTAGSDMILSLVILHHRVGEARPRMERRKSPAVSHSGNREEAIIVIDIEVGV